MDFNGNDVSGGGGGSVPEDIDINSVCASTGTFQTLGVGTCGNPLYKLPLDKAENEYSGGIIVSQGGTINLTGSEAIFTTIYAVGTTSFVRNIPLPAGNYTLTGLLTALTSAVNSQLQTDGSTNRITLSVNPTGNVVFFYTSGNSPTITVSNAITGGWYKIGNRQPSPYPPDTPTPFLDTPIFSDTSNQTVWNGYNFDETGTVYSGDMTITGSLSVNTLISDIEVEDAIITLNKNGILDNNTSGVVLNSSSNTNFSGLLKKDNSNDFYLFANSSTLPTESGWTPEQSANLYLNKLSVSSSTSIGTIDIETNSPSTFGLYVKGQLGQLSDLIRVVDDTSTSVMSVSPDGTITSTGGLTTNGQVRTITGITTGLSGAEYTLPNARGTAGQVLTDNGSGVVSFQDVPAGASIVSPDTLTSMTASNGQLLGVVNSSPRISADITRTRLQSPDTGFITDLTDTAYIIALDANEKMNIQQISTSIKGGLTNQTEVRVGGGPIGMAVLYLGDSRFVVNAGLSYMRSPDLQNEILMTNSLTSINHGAENRFEADATNTRLISNLGVTNSNIELGNFSNTVNINSIERSRVDITQHRFLSASETTEFKMNDSDVTITKDGTQRLRILGSDTLITSPNGTTNIIFADTTATLNTNGVGRLRCNLAESRLTSPDQSNVLLIENTGSKITVAGNDRIEATASAVRIGGAYNIPIVAGTEGQHLEVNASGNLAYTLGQLFATVQAGTTTAMALPLQNTYYPLPNATAGVGSGDFSFGPQGLLTYTGAFPLFVRVAGHVSIQRTTGGGADVFSLSCLKNGAFSSGIGECRAKFDDNNTFPLEFSFEGAVPVVNGDTLQLAVANEDDTATTADVYSYSFLVNRL